MNTRTCAGIAAVALVAAALSPSVSASATVNPTSDASPQISAAMQAKEDAARAAQAATISPAQRQAAAQRSGITAPSISTSSLDEMQQVQDGLASTNASSRVQPASAGASAASVITTPAPPHMFGPYANYANSPQHLPTALVMFAAPPVGTLERTALGTAVVNDAGALTGVTVTDPGAGYATAPVMQISSIGAGSGASATAVMSDSVGAVRLVSGGTGYNNPVTVTFSGGGGSGAAANATINVHGTITALTMTTPGTGYTSAPSVAFSDPSGHGSGAVAAAIVSKIVASVTVNTPGTGYITPGLRKFVDTLPVPSSVGVNGTLTPTTNDLGQYIPIAIPDTTTYPGSDYYEIGVVQYREQLHKDLPAAGTLLRGYVQLSTTVVPGKHVALSNALVGGTTVPVLLPNGQRAYAVDGPHYLGPIISATKDRPVRVLFRDLLPTGVNGDLFLPVDTTMMGAGAGPKGTDMSKPNMGIGADMQNPDCGKTPKPVWCYTENRATIHLHGGATPWISDGTPHQWITPAGETTDYPQGVSVKNVPDMPDPGAGAQTFFYTNQQSARLLFFHDHSWGITRLNVYAGEAGAYTITDPTEQRLVSNGTLPDAASTLPLVIEDKTFVPSTAELSVEDPTWDVAQWGGEGNLWVSHVYMAAQNAQDPTGVNQFGRWMYGPWFWPPTTDLQVGLITNPYAGKCSAGVDWCEPSTWTKMPGTPAESAGTEAFNDTPVVNGTAYPTLTVDPKSYRFRILNAANDRMWNLSLYKATGANNTEVKLLAADVAAAKDDTAVEPKVDESVSTPGPSWVQVGTEGGFLPTPVVIPPTTIGYITDPTVFDFGNVNKHSLLLGPAERADVVVDFSKYAGQTLILYNDAPAALPARDPRYDYYTDHADLRDTGGAAPTPEGYGPNTRTVMQIKVSAGTPAPAFDMTKLNVAFQATSLGGGGVFQTSQHPILVGQGVYDQAYDTSFGKSSNDGLMRMTASSLTFNTLTNASPTNRGAVVTKSTTSVAMHDEMGAAYDKIYGRAAGSMGVEAPATQPGQAQNLTLYPYVQPPTEEFLADVLPPGDSAVQIPTSSEYGNNIQLWKITHNGVDTHPIHFHFSDVQLVNRVSWDGIIRPADPNELGWKDTVRVNPLSDTIVAIRPLVPQVPFGVDVSKRSPNPAMPANVDPAMAGFVLTNPDGSTWNVDNSVMNFGWEYVWHCHILSHEEMDMMRPLKVDVPATAPDKSTVSLTTASGAVLTWNDPTPVNSNGSVNSSWGNPKNEIGYLVQRAPTTKNGTAGTYATIGTTLANQTTFTDPSGGGSTIYYYRVVAWNAAGSTTTSTVVTTAAPPAPTGPTGRPTRNGAQLAWNAPPAPPVAAARVATAAVAGDAVTEESDLPIIDYVVSYSDDGGATWSPDIETGSSEPTYTVTGLTAGVSYVFRVAAVSGAGTGAWSDITGSVTPYTYSVEPQAVTAVAAGNRGVTVRWGDPASTGASALTGFQVEASLTGGATWILTAPVGATTHAYHYADLITGASYRFRVTAITAAGLGTPSGPTSAVRPFTAAGAPGHLVGAPRGNRSVVLAWQAPSTDGGSTVTGYRVDYTVDRGAHWAVLVADTGSTRTTSRLYGLTAGRHYQFRVRSLNAAGSGTASVASVVLTPFTTPAAPRSLAAGAGIRSIFLSWKPPLSMGGSPVTGYQISYTVNRGKSWVVAVANTRSTKTAVVVSRVGRGVVYHFSVRAINGAGAGTRSAASGAVRVR